jgi:hypothetical protein
MSPTTATTRRPLGEISPSGPAPVAERAAYVYVGNGTFRPANDAAWREVDAWNEYADRITARSTAARSLRQ